jgi:tetratricopeptide (TPR) repeat protein
LGSFLTAVQAQVLPPSAAEALGQAQRSAAAALIEYDAHSPDRPLWVEALRLGREAAEAAPTHPAPQRFLAQAYQQVGFYARAWQAWEAYRTFGGTLDAVAERHVIEVARWMGIAAFDGGRRTEAIPYFEQLLVLAPFDLTANERLARTYIEGGEPLRARPYLEALAGAIPDLDDDLEYVRRLDAFGEAATQAYEAGLAAATAGDPATALARYRDATRDAPGFADAWRGLAETALALGQDGVAAQALERLLALVPDDARGLAVQATLQREETERLEAERLEAERLEAERLEAERAAAQAAAEAAARAAADAEAARLAAEREAAEAAAEAAARAAAEQDAAAEETAAAAAARTAAEAEAERVAAEAARAAQAEADRLAAEQEAARLAAEQEAARLAAEQEAARLAAEQEAARLAAEQEAARTATLDATASLTLGDVSHTHRAGDATANPSIAYVAAPGLRVDLSAHVDDVLYVRVTVLERSSDDPMWFQVCLVPPDVAVAPACSAADLLVLRAPGTYDAAVRWRDLGGAASVDWRNGVDALMWVLRRPDGTPVAGSGADASRYLPTALRVRTVAAPAGAALPDGR